MNFHFLLLILWIGHAAFQNQFKSDGLIFKFYTFLNMKETGINFLSKQIMDKPFFSHHNKMDNPLNYSSSMKLEYMLGNNYTMTPTCSSFVCSSQQIVSYAKNVFTRYHIPTKKTQQIVEECNDIVRAKEGSMILSKYFSDKNHKVMMVLKKAQQTHYISAYWIDKSFTSIIKISSQPAIQCVNFSYHPKKNLLYVLITDKSGHKSQQFIRVMEIQAQNSHHHLKNRMNKNKILINCALKKTGGVTEDLYDLTVSSDTKQIYLYGNNYFRQWILCFNQKSAKQSNYRNIQRNLKNEKILNLFWVKENDLGKNIYSINQNSRQGQCQDYLILMTSNFVVIVKKNQLLKRVEFPIQNPFFRIEQEPAQIALEKSLNQIYKTKFRMFPQKEEDNDTVKETETRTNTPISGQISKICSVSDGWVGMDQEGNKEIKFLGVLKNDKIFMYKIQSDLEIKIESQINQTIDSQSSIYSFLSSIKSISVSNDGHVALFQDEFNYMYFLNQEEGNQNNQVTPFYGIGHPHKSAIISLSTPELSMIMASVSQRGSLKIWNYSQEEKKIIIDNKPKVKPLSVIIHPCGFMVIVNFGLQIKIYGIVSSDLSELVAVKTSDICIELTYNKHAHILVSNQKSMIKLYEPFTLKCTGKIQPEDMRLQIIKSWISENGQYIVYQCNDFSVFRKCLNSVFNSNHEKVEVNEYLMSQNKKQGKKDLSFCHKQSEEYTCFYYDFGQPKMNNNINDEEKKQILLDKNDIFVGFTKKKYMVLYGNSGKQLVAEFSTQDCYIIQAIVKENLLFLATSKGAIKNYLWPIIQSHCEIQKINEQNACLKPPKCLQQFQVWMDFSPITLLHSLPNCNQLAVGSKDGFIGFISYQIYKNGNQIHEKDDCQFNNERKKMIKAMNNIKLMKVSEIDRINKLIEKTENDIEKIDFQIKNEKIRKNIAIDQQQEDYKKNLKKRRNAYFKECEQSFEKILAEIRTMQMKMSKRKSQIVSILENKHKIYEERKEYQKKRIQQIKKEQQNLKKKQRQKILSLIQKHKENIKQKKQLNLQRIFRLEKEFQEFVKSNFSSSYQVANMESINLHQETMNEQIWVKVLKVEELKNDITEKQRNLQQITQRFMEMEEEDQKLQEIFEDHLEVYNNRRQSNLILHSELLKMQNQLLERQHILSKKDQLIAMAFQEKQANLIFRDFVKGSLSKMQQEKQKAINFYMKKQDELNSIFSELKDQIDKGESKKLQICKLNQKIALFEKQKNQNEGKIATLMQKIQQFKKFLLLQGVSEDSEQKKIYQELQKLLTQIKWLQKRFIMACANETKIVGLKKSGMRQVIQQNKNLLEQCNKLREEGIQYDKQINHLRSKLGEANKIIEFEKKIRSQNQVLIGQTQKLDLIRKMFKEQIDCANQDIKEEQEVEYPF